MKVSRKKESSPAKAKAPKEVFSRAYTSDLCSCVLLGYYRCFFRHTLADVDASTSLGLCELSLSSLCVGAARGPSQLPSISCVTHPI